MPAAFSIATGNTRTFDVTRFFDVLIALLLGVIFFPALLLIAVIIKISSRGPAIFSQQRVGKNGVDFTLYKFRTMHIDAEKAGTLTVGHRDNRVTGIGYFLRKYKIDELPQLYNVLRNDMSFVGPRPELRKYVCLYTEEQKKILVLKPGITDYASIRFRNESALLALQHQPELYYTREILPVKIQLNSKYLHDKNLRVYFIIIFNTLLSVLRPMP